MAKVFINVIQVQEAIAKIDDEIEKINDLFDKQNQLFKKLESDKRWYGSSKDSCIDKYKQFSVKYHTIISDLTRYKDFLFKAVESYKGLLDQPNADDYLPSH